jgi:hypothetical protein
MRLAIKRTLFVFNLRKWQRASRILQSSDTLHISVQLYRDKHRRHTNYGHVSSVPACVCIGMGVGDAVHRTNSTNKSNGSHLHNNMYSPPGSLSITNCRICQHGVTASVAGQVYSGQSALKPAHQLHDARPSNGSQFTVRRPVNMPGNRHHDSSTIWYYPKPILAIH